VKPKSAGGILVVNVISCAPPVHQTLGESEPLKAKKPTVPSTSTAAFDIFLVCTS